MPWALWGAGLSFTLGCLIILLGLALLRNDPGQRLNRVASLMLSFGGLGMLQVALELNAFAHGHGTTASTQQTARNLTLIWQFFFPALLYFVLIFPQEVKWYRRVPFLVLLVFGPYAFHLGLTLLADGSGGTFFLDRVPQQFAWLGGLRRTTLLALSLLYDAHVFLFSLVNLNYTLITIGLLTIRARQSSSPRLKGQLGAISLGLTACLALYALADPLPNIFGLQRLAGPYVRNAGAALALLMGSGSIAYAIVRHKFLDTALIVRRSIVFLVPAFVVVGGYLSLSALVKSIFGNVHDFNPGLVDPLILLMLLATLQPMVSRLEEFVEGYMQRDRREGRLVLQDLSRDIVTILDLERLAARLTEAIGESLVVERCALYRAGGESFTPLAQFDQERRVLIGDALAEDSRLNMCGALLRPGALSEAPQSLQELADPAGSGWPDDVAAEAFQRVASETGFHLFLPVRHGQEVLGVIAVGRKLTRGRFNREDLSLLSTLANQTGAALKNSSLYAESLRSAALEEEIHLARQIQMKYLPNRFPRHPSLDLHGFNQPSRQVGGDYFDVVELKSEYLVAIADVAGKGVPAALVMSTVQASLRTQAGEDRGVAEMLARINTLMLQSGVEGRFATCFLARVNLATLSLSYSNAGHNPPLLLRADGTVEELTRGGLPLGAFDDPMLEEGEVSLRPGDLLVMYTDGVTEAQDGEGELFGEERLVDSLRALPPDMCAQEITEHIRDQVRAFSPGEDLDDDMTVMVLRTPVLARPEHHGERERVELGSV